MRVLVLIHEYPPVGGGGGKVAEDISKGLVTRGHQVRVLTTWLNGLPLRENQAGVDVVRIKTGRKHAFKATFTDMLLYLFFAFWQAAFELSTWKPDIIHVHFAVPAGVLGYLLSTFSKIPYILTAHLGDVPGGVPEKTEKWFRWVAPFTPLIWKKACRVVAVSEYTKTLALQRYPVNIRVINNGVSTSEFDPGNISVHNPPTLIFVGRLVPQKNPLQIVQSLSEIKDLQWRAVLVGDGSLKKEMEDETTRAELSGRVTFTGWITPDEVHNYLRNSDILFMPSLSEGLPVIGVQALSMGLAFIVGKVGGFIDLVEDGINGFSHLPSESYKYSQSLRLILNDHENLLQFRRNSREFSKNFDLDRVVDDYEKLMIECKEEH
jgi:glycosyltransferase involved in cell wall biosynthesis